MSNIVQTTTNLSILVQIITGVFGLDGFRYTIPKEHLILLDILKMETIVQFIELGMYIWFHFNFDINTIATTRYYDWVITTPTMLISTLVFLIYQKDVETNKLVQNMNLKQVLLDNKQIISHIIILNTMMLGFGYLGETGIIDKKIATILGFIPFIMCFSILYNNYGKHSTLGKKITKYMFFIWSLYGIVYMLPTVPKNVFYNILDILAKNFWGLFIYFRIKELHIKK